MLVMPESARTYMSYIVPVLMQVPRSLQLQVTVTIVKLMSGKNISVSEEKNQKNIISLNG